MLGLNNSIVKQYDDSNIVQSRQSQVVDAVKEASIKYLSYEDSKNASENQEFEIYVDTSYLDFILSNVERERAQEI